MEKETIKLTFDLGQVAQDLLMQCNIISRNVRDEALADLKADVGSPDDAQTRSLINRAITEAVGNIKFAGQRWMTKGRKEDTNKLERIVKEVKEVNDGEGGTKEQIVYESVSLEFAIPNFNISVTDALKSHCHKYMVDYTMGRFLHDQLADKAKEYSDDATTDYGNILQCLNSRNEYTQRRPSFI